MIQQEEQGSRLLVINIDVVVALQSSLVIVAKECHRVKVMGKKLGVTSRIGVDRLGNGCAVGIVLISSSAYGAGVCADGGIVVEARTDRVAKAVITAPVTIAGLRCARHVRHALGASRMVSLAAQVAIGTSIARVTCANK